MVFKRCLLPGFALAMLAFFSTPASASLLLYTTSNTALIQLSLTDGSTVATQTYTDLSAPGSLVDVKGLAYNPVNTTLYGLFDLSISGIDTGELVTIDPTTGNYNVVAQLDSSIGTDSSNLVFLPAFDSSGNLYIGVHSGSPYQVDTVNLNTGAFTVIGNSGASTTGGFAWDSAHSRLLTTTMLASPSGTDLESVNTSTGAISIFQTSSVTIRSDAIAVNPVTGALLGFDQVSFSSQLDYMDLTTYAAAGTLTSYANGGNRSALVFIDQQSVPEPVSGALLGLGAAALWLLRKRLA